MFTYDVFYVIIEVFMGNSHVGTERKERKMAQRQQKKTYRVRYDRIVFVLALLAVMIWILSSCISSCSKKDDKPSNNSSVVDNMSSTDPISVGTADSLLTSTPTEPTITYAEITLMAEELHRGDLILANSTYPCEFDASAIKNGSTEEVEFVTIKSVLDTKSEKHYTARDWEVGMDKDAALAMDAMLEGFYTVTKNTDIRMISGYSGDSEDQDYRTGRTCKFGIFPNGAGSYHYRNEGTYAWIAENAHNYGFILRYPDDKSGYFDETITDHTSATFRYVGVAAATYIAQNGLCLEEYLDTVKTYSINNMLEIKGSTNTYGVYYAAANPNGPTVLSVPESGTPYEVSGNNKDGFIVTVTLSGGTTAPAETTAPSETTAPLV